MLSKRKNHDLIVGPFRFSVTSNIRSVHDYLEHHYEHSIAEKSDNCFTDYHVALDHGPRYRRYYKPQASFKFNYSTPFKPLPLTQAHAMLEWGMNWVISSHANHFFIIHAAALEKDGKGIIITAASGSGKSTLCAYLVSQGWRLLSDELALISPKTMEMHGLARPINLKNQSIELMKPYYNSNSFSEIALDTHKGTICLLKPPQSSCLNAHVPVKPSHIVFVKYNEHEPCYVEPVEKSLALTEIIRNSFNFSLLNKRGFECARNLIKQTNAFYIEYNNFEACESAILNVMNKKATSDQTS